MRFIDLRHLSGPNVFSASTVTIARLELDELTGKETTDFAGFGARLTALLPGLAGMPITLAAAPCSAPDQARSLSITATTRPRCMRLAASSATLGAVRRSLL